MPPGRDAWGRLMPILASSAVTAAGFGTQDESDQAEEPRRRSGAEGDGEEHAQQQRAPDSHRVDPLLHSFAHHRPAAAEGDKPHQEHAQEQEDRAENQVHVFLEEQGDGRDRHRRGCQEHGQGQVGRHRPSV